MLSYKIMILILVSLLVMSNKSHGNDRVNNFCRLALAENPFLMNYTTRSEFHHMKDFYNYFDINKTHYQFKNYTPNMLLDFLGYFEKEKDFLLDPENKLGRFAFLKVYNINYIMIQEQLALLKGIKNSLNWLYDQNLSPKQVKNLLNLLQPNQKIDLNQTLLESPMVQELSLELQQTVLQKYTELASIPESWNTLYSYQSAQSRPYMDLKKSYIAKNILQTIGFQKGVSWIYKLEPRLYKDVEIFQDPVKFLQIIYKQKGFYDESPKDLLNQTYLISQKLEEIITDKLILHLHQEKYLPTRFKQWKEEMDETFLAPSDLQSLVTVISDYYNKILYTIMDTLVKDGTELNIPIEEYISIKENALKAGFSINKILNENNTHLSISFNKYNSTYGANLDMFFKDFKKALGLSNLR